MRPRGVKQGEPLDASFSVIEQNPLFAQEYRSVRVSQSVLLRKGDSQHAVEPAGAAQPWISQPSVARAASMTASANEGCAWMIRATSE